MEHFEEIKALSLVISKINAMSFRWTQEHNLNPYAIRVLYSLAENESMTQKQICAVSGMPKQTVNNVIRTLQKEGMVKLIVLKSDRREKAVTLTEEGIRYLEDTLTPIAEFESRIIQRMGKENHSYLLQYLTCYSEAMEQEIERNL